MVAVTSVNPDPPPVGKIVDELTLTRDSTSPRGSAVSFSPRAGEGRDEGAPPRVWACGTVAEPTLGLPHCRDALSPREVGPARLRHWWWPKSDISDFDSGWGKPHCSAIFASVS